MLRFKESRTDISVGEYIGENIVVTIVRDKDEEICSYLVSMTCVYNLVRNKCVNNKLSSHSFSCLSWYQSHTRLENLFGS